MLQKLYVRLSVNHFYVGSSEPLFQFSPAKATATRELVFISQMKSLNSVRVCSGSTVNPKPSNTEEGHSTALWGFCHLHSKNAPQISGSVEMLNRFQKRRARSQSHCSTICSNLNKKHIWCHQPQIRPEAALKLQD